MRRRVRLQCDHHFGESCFVQRNACRRLFATGTTTPHNAHVSESIALSETTARSPTPEKNEATAHREFAPSCLQSIECKDVVILLATAILPVWAAIGSVGAASAIACSVSLPLLRRAQSPVASAQGAPLPSAASALAEPAARVSIPSISISTSRSTSPCSEITAAAGAASPAARTAVTVIGTWMPPISSVGLAPTASAA